MTWQLLNWWPLWMWPYWMLWTSCASIFLGCRPSPFWPIIMVLSILRPCGEITMADLPTIQRWCFFPSFSLWMYPACVYRPKHDNPVQSKYIYCYMLYDLALKRNKVYSLLLSYDMFAFSMCIFMTQTFVQTKVRKKRQGCVLVLHTRDMYHITTVLHWNISKTWRHSITWSLSSFHIAYIAKATRMSESSTVSVGG